MSILKIQARQILDSRGNPTVEVDVTTKLGLFRAAVPSGASTGIHEALELRDKGKHYLGKGVTKAVANVNSLIGPALIKKGIPVTEQKAIDDFMIDELDASLNKAKMGANAILGVSLAVCKAGAAEKDRPLYRYIADMAGNKEVILPVPAFNVINGGSHAGNKLAMQEFMILPIGAKNFSDSLRIGAEVYHNLKSVIKKKYGLDACNVGDEGGFAPNIQDNFEGLELLQKAIENAGYCGRVVIGMDVAASEFFKDGRYDLDFKNPKSNQNKWLTSDQLAEVYNTMCRKYPIVTIEDPFEQDDWDAWIKFNRNSKIQIVGDDLLVTNPVRVQRAINCGACNALLLKVNQIGSVTESIEACRMAQRAGWGVMVSHRSGETEDTTIADLVVGLRTGQTNLTDAVIVEGEADESDDEIESQSIQQAPDSNIESDIRVVYKKDVKDCQSVCLKSLIHQNLNREMKTFVQNLRKFTNILYSQTKISINMIQSQLMATYSLIQNVSYNLRIASNDLFYFEDNIDLINTVGTAFPKFVV